MKTIHPNVSKKSFERKENTRGEIDLLRSRLRLLDGKDRLIMTMYLEKGCSFFQISKLTDLCETTIARRINRLKKRILEGKYITCLRNREKFSKEQMEIAKDCFLKGLSMREITVRRNQSLYHVRETITKIKSILNECEYAKIK